jgi:peptidoglycan/LPS O-acetylase OafA/YrhL
LLLRLDSRELAALVSTGVAVGMILGVARYGLGIIAVCWRRYGTGVPLLEVLSTPSDDLLPASTRAESVLTRHMPGVDLLRGLAILAVIIFHGFSYSTPLFPWHNKLAAALFHLTSFGWTGVNLFFTLSGFLITGNLIDSDGKSNFYSRFYIRRALRILPAYFLVLIILGVTRTASLNYLVVCVIFLANWPKLLLHGSFVLYPVLWSLAVEEQFYAAWPWLYRKLHKNGLLALCVAMILFCPILRGVTISLSKADIFSKTFMIGDNLAVGAAIAILCRSRRLSLTALVWIGTAALCISGLTLLVLSNTGHTIKDDALGASIGYTMLEWFTGGMLILMLCAYRTRPIQRGLGFLLFFGEISYGLYLIHMLCEMGYDHFFGNGYLTHSGALLVRFVVANGIAILLATLSKLYFENPIMRLKERIPAAR